MRWWLQSTHEPVWPHFNMVSGYFYTLPSHDSPDFSDSTTPFCNKGFIFFKFVVCKFVATSLKYNPDDIMMVFFRLDKAPSGDNLKQFSGWVTLLMESKLILLCKIGRVAFQSNAGSTCHIVATYIVGYDQVKITLFPFPFTILRTKEVKPSSHSK